MTAHRDQRGFALLEALIACMLMATALAALVHLVSIASTQSLAMRRSALALVLAQAKLEELRALPWRYDVAGVPVSSLLLAASPPSTLTNTIDGWVEVLDRFGELVNQEEAAGFERRWSIARFSVDDPDTLLLQVCVFVRDGAPAALLGDACVQGIRTRKP
jgi:type II secretory pathway pseudopilin PulG